MKFLILVLLLLTPQLHGTELLTGSRALAFLKSLSPSQKDQALFEFAHESRTTWHYLPATSWTRTGISLGELTGSQKELFHNWLQASLSESGHAKVQQIIELESVLAELQNNAYTRDPEKYFIAIYGNPENPLPWAWSFEGHHVSLNFAVAADKISMAPRFLGANPARVLSGNQEGLRTLHREEDLGLALVNSLSAEQLRQTVFQNSAFRDIVTRNDTLVSALEPVGIPHGDLDASQKDMLLSLIEEYLSIMPEELARERRERIEKEDLSEIRFGWAGATQIGQPHYYRIQGKTFLIEFDNTQNQANHIHSVWRDFDGDWGEDIISQHYATTRHSGE